MLRYQPPFGIVFLPKTKRQASNNILPILFLYCLDCGGKTGAVAGSILHRERPILRRAHRALCCLMHRRGLHCGGTIGLNQGSQRGHGYGRVEADPIVLAFSKFARQHVLK